MARSARPGLPTLYSCMNARVAIEPWLFEALRAQLYAKLGTVSDETKEVVRRARAGDRTSIDACFDLLDP